MSLAEGQSPPYIHHDEKYGDIEIHAGFTPNILDITRELLDLPLDVDPKLRRRMLVFSEPYQIFMTLYLAGQGEKFHGHPTNNFLQIIYGEFNISIQEPGGEVRDVVCKPGQLILLVPGMPHKVVASPNVTPGSVIMVGTVIGLSTDDETYSFPIDVHHHDHGH